MAKTYYSSNRWALTGLFKRINLGDNPKLLRCEASQLVDKVNSDDITAAKKSLVSEGYSEELVQKIAAVFVLMGLPKKKTANSRLKLTDNHILQKITTEHSMCRCYLQDLKEVAQEIKQMNSISSLSSEFRRFTLIVEYLCQFRRHIEREEDIIFHYLKKYGWDGLCKTASDEHTKILVQIDNLYALAVSFDMIKPNEFKIYLRKIVDALISMMRDHLDYEEELLWPISLLVIDDAQVWQAIKKVCDEFEY